jgi:hypothetical protein
MIVSPCVGPTLPTPSPRMAASESTAFLVKTRFPPPPPPI